MEAIKDRQGDTVMKCANCGGTLVYDVARYGLVCDHCGQVKPLHRPEEGILVGGMDFNAAIAAAGSHWGASKKLLACKSCGAQLLCDMEQMSGMCPFCGSAVVLSAEEANCGIAPNAIIPFKIPKEPIEKRFYRWNKFAFWSPEKFRRGKVLENLTPVYVPYWTFETDSITTYTGRFGHTVGSGDSARTTWTQRTGIVEKHFSSKSVCGSRKFFNDPLLKPVSRFSNSDLIPYEPEMLSGMSAEVPTIGLEEAWNYVRLVDLKKDIMEACRANEHADCYSNIQYSTEFYNTSFKYVLAPVWLSGCKYGGKIYNVAASGTNGSGNCNRPLSIAKLITFLILLIAYIVAANILNMGPLFVTLGIAAVVAALIIYVIMFAVTLSSQQRDEGTDYSKLKNQ